MSTNNTRKCEFCRKDFEVQLFAKLPCGHYICCKCSGYVQWTLKICPTCKIDINNKVGYLMFDNSRSMRQREQLLNYHMETNQAK